MLVQFTSRPGTPFRSAPGALTDRASAWKNVATKSGLSLDEVKKWSKVLQSQELVKKDGNRGFVRTEAGERALSRSREGGHTS